MSGADVLVDAFNRIRDLVHEACAGLDAQQLTHRLDADANSIGWLIWHLTRIQDDHVSPLRGSEQVYLTGGWCDRFALPYDMHANGYGQSSAEVGAFRVDSDRLLRSYHDAVHHETVAYVAQLSDADLDRVVDERWDPPVTLGVRLVSVVSDDIQHAGQANFIRGIVERTAR